jgi:GNAT superfamily N-acetyltransferase
MEIRLPTATDFGSLADLAAGVVGPDRAGPFIRSHFERHHLLVAGDGNDPVGVIAYRTDWFQCTFVSLVCVDKDHRRQGIARELFRGVERMSSSPRIFSSTEETNGVAIRMHTALGFVPSGHIDNLPQGYRELLFYKSCFPGSRA